jgi:hypothetical protein
MMGEEEVPQATPAGLLLQVTDHRRAHPGVPGLLVVPYLCREYRLRRIDAFVHEREEAFAELLRAVVVAEVHRALQTDPVTTLPTGGYAAYPPTRRNT